MTVAASLLLGACLVGWLSPMCLRRLTARGTDAVVALVTWLMSIVAVVVTTALAVLLLLLPDHGPHALSAVHSCWSSWQHGATPAIEAVGGVIGIALLLGLVIRLVITSGRSARRRAEARQAHLAVLRIAARHEPGCPSTLWLDHDEPMAFSLAGAPGVVVATEGLNRYLSHEQVDAVLVHERAHLAGHHHLIVAISDALATMAPFLPLFNRAPIAVRELVELAADETAVRACGPEVVRAALLGVEGNSAPGPALAMSRDAPTARLARLQHVGLPLSPPRRLLSCGLAGVMAMLMPSIAALGALFLLAVVVCSQH